MGHLKLTAEASRREAADILDRSVRDLTDLSGRVEPVACRTADAIKALANALAFLRSQITNEVREAWEPKDDPFSLGMNSGLPTG